MPLEGGDGFISGLVVTNPVNATDQVAQGDDHLRLIKTALKGSFPAITGAVTATHTELNALDGITSSVAELNIMDGVTLTAAQINDAAFKSEANNFLAAQTITAAASVPLTLGGTATTSIMRFNNNAGSLQAQIGWGAAVQDGMELYAQSGDYSFRNPSGGSFLVLDSGVVVTPNTVSSEVGFKGTPQNVQNGDYGILLADCGKTIYKASGGAGETITIPANGTIAIPVGSIIRVVNRGGGALSIAITSDTLELAGAGTTGTRTLADKGVAVLEKVEATVWMISGAGIS